MRKHFTNADAQSQNNFPILSTLESREGHVEKAGGLAAIHKEVWRIVDTFFAHFPLTLFLIGVPRRQVMVADNNLFCVANTTRKRKESFQSGCALGKNKARELMIEGGFV